MASYIRFGPATLSAQNTKGNKNKSNSEFKEELFMLQCDKANLIRKPSIDLPLRK